MLLLLILLKILSAPLIVIPEVNRKLLDTMLDTGSGAPATTSETITVVLRI